MDSVEWMRRWGSCYRYHCLSLPDLVCVRSWTPHLHCQKDTRGHEKCRRPIGNLAHRTCRPGQECQDLYTNHRRIPLKTNQANPR